MDALTLAPGAFIAGVLMFLAPCTLPIIPGYLVFIAGLPAVASAKEGVLAQRTANTATRRRRIMLNACAFVLGFSIIFILLGTFAAAIGGLLGHSRDYIARAAGFLVIFFGLMMLDVVHLPVIGQEWHVKIPKFLSVGRWESSLLIGALFALGWSPCIGPILGTVLFFASTSSTIVQGALLLGIFSLGLAIPFLVTALLIDSAGAVFNRWGRAVTLLSSIGGILLIVLGVLIVFGMMGVATVWCDKLFDMLGYDKLYTYL